jgi:hypothetical protein
VNTLCAQPPADRQAVDTGERDVENDEVRRRALHRRERSASVFLDLDGVPLGGERAMQHAPDRRIVVDHQDRR